MAGKRAEARGRAGRTFRGFAQKRILRAMTHGPRAALGAALCSLFLSGCGGAAPEPKDATDEAAAKSESTEEPKTEKSSEGDAPAAAESKSEESDGEKKSDATSGGDPTFPEGATVDQAMAAVPKGTARANIDQDRLAEPLQQQSVYEPCKVGAQHFKVRVAVWAGQAVGVDVTTTNKKLADCIDKQVRAIKWPDKVRSLNTVEFSF
jgi:hypothetical protein